MITIIIPSWLLILIIILLILTGLEIIMGIISLIIRMIIKEKLKKLKNFNIMED